MKFSVILALVASAALVNGAMQRVQKRHHHHHHRKSSTTTVAEVSSSTLIALVSVPTVTSSSTRIAVSGAGGVLQPSAVAEAQKRDSSAVRAFSSVSLKSSSGQCLFVDPTAGDFRENLIPIQVKDCDGSANELWDIVTSGVHDNVKGQALVVSSLVQGCLNFDGRNNVVNLFSCGGRADGTGQTSTSQLFPFTSGQASILFAPNNANGATCLVSDAAKRVLVPATCSGAATQEFSIVASGSSASTTAAVITTSSSTGASATSVADVTVFVTDFSDCTSTTTSAAATKTTTSVSKSSSTLVAIVTSVPPTTTTSSSTSSTQIAVSGAGGVLQPSAVAEAQKRDNTAVRAFSSASLKSASGQCLFVDPTAGDFRQNLIPIAVKDCDGSTNEKWDIITQGVHDNVAGQALVVSSLTQGCMNFDPRRAQGNQALLFSCGGRADGGGQVTNSQLFPFATGQTTIVLAPENANNATCLVPNTSTGLLDVANCTGGSDQVFSIVA